MSVLDMEKYGCGVNSGPELWRNREALARPGVNFPRRGKGSRLFTLAAEIVDVRKAGCWREAHFYAKSAICGPLLPSSGAGKLNLFKSRKKIGKSFVLNH
jgi:hypothetical protein